MKYPEIAIVIFWISIFLTFWAYFGYYVFLRFVALFYYKDIRKTGDKPFISVIVTAYNEEIRIKQKIDNIFETSYPHDKLEIIVASDCSTDKTNEIVASFKDRGVRLIAFTERYGKHYCQAEAVQRAKGGIVILSDAATFLKKDAIENIVSNFSDPTIGVVSGMDNILSESGAVQGEGLYVRYEMALRSLESKVCSLVGASGSFYAVRKELYKNIYGDMSADFFMPIVAYKNRYRTVLDETAIGYYKILNDTRKEFQRKVRTIVHGIDILVHFGYILNPFKYGFYSFQLLSHKLGRWLVPFALIAALMASGLLISYNSFYKTVFAIQIAAYLSALAAHYVKKLQSSQLFKIPYFFIMANVSILVAWIEYLKGERYITWQATKR